MPDLLADFAKLLIDFEDFIADGCKSGRKPPYSAVLSARLKNTSAPSQKLAANIGSLSLKPETAAQLNVNSAVLKTDDSMQKIAEEIKNCRLCGLSALRHCGVPGEGVENPLVMVIGEAPGADEDATGRPFVGQSGQYLDKWLESVHLSRQSNIFIANTIKCRPPHNRDPEPEESQACQSYLLRQISLLKPQVILACGRYAAQFICRRKASLASLRDDTCHFDGIPIVVTYHPAAVLRNSDLRRPVWEDMKKLKAMIADRL